MTQTAFPSPRTTDSTPGISLRDYFAAHAMQGLVSNSEWMTALSRYCDQNPECNPISSLAAHAYFLADAMLARGTQE